VGKSINRLIMDRYRYTKNKPKKKVGVEYLFADVGRGESLSSYVHVVVTHEHRFASELQLLRQSQSFHKLYEPLRKHQVVVNTGDVKKALE